MDWQRNNGECHFTATVPAAIFAILTSYGDCDEIFVVTMISLAIASQGVGSSGLSLIALDMSPNYVGIFSGIVHTCYSIASLLAPFIVGILTPHVNCLLLHFRSIYFDISSYNNFFFANSIGLFIGMASCVVVGFWCIDRLSYNFHDLGLSKNSIMEYWEKTVSKFMNVEFH